MDKRGEYQGFPSKNAFLRVPKNFVVQPCCAVFQKISGSDKVYRYDGLFQDFPSSFFCLTVSIISVRGAGILWCFFNFGYPKVWDKMWGYQDFPSKIFCLTGTKFFVGESFSVSLISGIEKLHVAEGYVTVSDFLSKFFCLTVPKNFVGEPFCAAFHQKFLDKRGGASRFSVENFMSHSDEKCRRGTLSCFTDLR